MLDWKTACGKALTPFEREFLRSHAEEAERAFGHATLVNIGVFRCASMYCLRAGAPRSRIVGVDIKACDVPINPSLKAEFIIGDSTKCHSQFKDEIHLLFIDGNHYYNYVVADLKFWAPKVVSQGFLILHDCYPKPKDLQRTPHLEGVNRAVREWYADNKAIWDEIPAGDSLRSFIRK